MRIDVCICTFRRDFLYNTLTTVAAQGLPSDVEITVIVADNDEESLIRDKVMAWGDELALNIHYVFAPKFNISIARNACLDAATGDFIAFIDDDELAHPNWLSSLISRAEETGADIVFGPVQAIYPEHAPDWIKVNDFHSNTPTYRNGVIETGFSCNVLIDRGNTVLRDLRFDEAFGRTGGEDVDFFFRAHRAGLKLEMSNHAHVDEPVAAARLQVSWVLQRMYNVGAIYGHCALAGGTRSRLRMVVLAILKCLYCFAGSLLSILSKPRAMFWLTRGFFHAGVVRGGFSAPTREAYGVSAT